MIERNKFTDIVVGYHSCTFQGIGNGINGTDRTAEVFQRGGKFQHRVPRLLQIVFTAHDTGGNGKSQILIFHTDIIAKVPRFMLIACQHGQVHCIQHIGNGRLAVFRKTGSRVFLHLIRIGKGRTVQSGNTHFLGVSEILKVRLTTVDVSKGHAVGTDRIKPCYKGAGVHHTLDAFHVLLVGKQGTAVFAIYRQQMHQSVRTVKNKVATVEIGNAA